MIRTINIKCDADEMKDILNILIMANRYQLPNNLVLSIKEDKPLFPWSKKKRKNKSLLTKDNNIIDVSCQEIQEENINGEKNEINNKTNESIKETIVEDINSNENNKQNDKEIKELLNNEENEDNILKEKIEILIKENNDIKEDYNKIQKSNKKISGKLINQEKEYNKLADETETLLEILKHNINKLSSEEQDIVLKLYYGEKENEE